MHEAGLRERHFDAGVFRLELPQKDLGECFPGSGEKTSRMYHFEVGYDPDGPYGLVVLRCI